MKFNFSLEQTRVIIVAVGVILESVISYYAIQQIFPQLNKIGPLQALFAEIGIAIFIAIVVYLYSVKAERIRKNRLQRQIISSFEMLSTDFAWLATQRSSTSINEEFITKKNLRVFLIQNLIGMLPERIGTNLSLKIPEFCEKALSIPTIIKPLDQTKTISVDYTGCESMLLEITNLLTGLRDIWKINFK